MITRMSTLFLRTLREDPADAEVPSHKLLVRAGYIRRVSPGVYSWLPLGLKVLRNIERVVREEMQAIGAQEIELPALLPREPYEVTNRWTEYGDGLFRLKDRKYADMLLGPPHEEMFTLMVKDMYSSYKDLPATLYQIQTKYRDEARPRAGLIRGREFVMKDAYSFDIDEAGLDASYNAMREAWEILTNNRAILDTLAARLLEEETLDEAQLAQIFKDVVKAPERPVWNYQADAAVPGARLGNPVGVSTAQASAPDAFQTPSIDVSDMMDTMRTEDEEQS